jgi:CHAT domain-containing protein
MLRVPLEFAFSPESGEYLALKHPLTRFVIDAPTLKVPFSPSFLNDLWVRKDALRVLLIASNTEPWIDGVEEETKAVNDLFQAWTGSNRLQIQVDYLDAEQATYERVREELRECRYHVVHYAGHGRYDHGSPEKSGLFFRERKNRSSPVRRMSASELKLLLENSDLRLFYLSCCLGSRTGDRGQLLDDDFLGIADSLVYAGVPAVMGFRWPVSDDGAKRLALAFYQSLLDQGDVDLALLHARREVAMANKDDQTWLSPILVIQR